MEMQKDLLNRVKHARGAALGGPELKDHLPRVMDKFAKHGELLFNAEYQEKYTHPKVIAANLAEMEKMQPVVKKKRSKSRRKKK